MDLRVGDIVDMSGGDVTLLPPSWGMDEVRRSRFSAAVVDSREVAPGALFVALKGERTDGAHFVPDAYARGALAALTSRPPLMEDEHVAARRAAVGDAPFVAVVMPDPLSALQHVATAWRARHSGVRMIGVTGSVGKTTTREAIAGALSQAMPVLVSPRSYNNEIGLPLTLLGLGSDHRAAVLEMGMYAPGEIAALARIARPHIGVVTMVAPVHLERLGTMEAIAAAKEELVQALPPDGLAVLNGDDPLVRAMGMRSNRRVAYVGLDGQNDWCAREVEDRGLDGLAFMLVHDGWRARVETQVVGRHFLFALLAAAAVAAELGLPPDKLAPALQGVRIGERQRVLHAPGDVLVIDDAWNASPPSVLAALDVLAGVPGRRVAVLGEMRELGGASETGHRAVGRRAAAVAQTLVAVGPGGAVIAEEARRAGLPPAAVRVVSDRLEASAALEGLLRPGDAVLVKGSRALHLEDVVRWLMDRV